MGAPSPKYTAELKRKAVELYKKSGTTYAEVARGLGCDPVTGTIIGAALDIFEYIEVVYNRAEIHTALGDPSPVEFEEANWLEAGGRPKAA